MLLLVGLGNPGPKYQDNRHNIGFMAVDELHRHWSRSPFKSPPKFQGDIAEAEIAGEKVLLLKPTTFMNESGRSVQPVMQFYKIAPKDVVVFHDELDLAPAKFRMKKGGGHAGHNGLRSITSLIGADFRRGRMGIGHPGDKDAVIGHVLKDFAKADQDWLAKMLDACARHAEFLVSGKDDQYQTKVMQEINPPRSSKTTAAKDANKETKNGV